MCMRGEQMGRDRIKFMEMVREIINRVRKISIYIYIYIYRERERERERDTHRRRW